jgi:hypothetical protein
VQEAVDAAQVHEGAVLGDVLDHAVEDALLQLLEGLLLEALALLLQQGAAREDDVAARLLNLMILKSNVWPMNLSRLRVGRSSTWLPGRNALHADVDLEAALDAAR